jgi:uncharacterized membrane protein YfhO
MNEELKEIIENNSFDIFEEKTEAVPEKRKMWYLLVHISAFGLPFILMLVAFRSVEIFPFGDRQIMVVDSWHQYYPFLQELHHKLTGFGSLLYSWNTGAGTNFLTLMAYYAATPLYLLSVFFPQEYLREFMMIITIVKISCSGLFFSIYLRGMGIHDFQENTVNIDNKKYCSINKGFAIIGFSVLYALSAYAVGYYWCIMWLDCMALLPLVILGLERLIDKGRYKLYIISLGITIIADYYIGVFVCIFVALYYIVLYFSKTASPSAKDFMIKTAKAAGASVIGVGLAMFILLPAYFWFGNTGNSGSAFNRDIDTYNTLLDIITNLLPNTTPTIRSGLPNIASGMLVLIFAGLFFMNSKIRLREKLFTAGFLVFMLFSFNLNILDYYWHGMHFPNEIPYRQAFVFSFVLVAAAYKSYMTFDVGKITKSAVLKFCLCVLGFLIIAEQWYRAGDKFDFSVFYVSIAMLIVYMAVLLIYKNKKLPKNYLAAILMFAMVFEGGMAAVKGAATTGTSDRVSYAPSKAAVQETVRRIYESDDDLFFRLEMSRWYSTNDPALYGYRGISQFSSVANSRFARTLELTGIAATIPSNRFLYSSATPVFNMFLSLKYLMAREEEPQHEINSVAFEEYLSTTMPGNDGTERTVAAYKNKYWLPLGFIVSEAINEVRIGEPNIFITQNEMMKKASGITENVFGSIHPSDSANVNLTESRAEYGVYTYSITNTSQKGTVSHTYTNETTRQVYIYLRSTRSRTAHVSVNGVSRSYEINRGITIDCGLVLAGQDILVSFDVDAGSSGTFNIFVAGFDEEVFRQGYDILNQNTFNIEEFKDTKITGTITVPGGGGIFFTSIPFDRGWNLRINGVKTEINPLSEAEINDVVSISREPDAPKPDPRQITKITDGFVTAPIPAGTHTIELYYVTEGLIPGIIISLFCVLVIVGLEADFRKFKIKKLKFKTKTKKTGE